VRRCSLWQQAAPDSLRYPALCTITPPAEVGRSRQSVSPRGLAATFRLLLTTGQHRCGHEHALCPATSNPGGPDQYLLALALCVQLHAFDDVPHTLVKIRRVCRSRVPLSSDMTFRQHFAGSCSAARTWAMGERHGRWSASTSRSSPSSPTNTFRDWALWAFPRRLSVWNIVTNYLVCASTGMMCAKSVWNIATNYQPVAMGSSTLNWSGFRTRASLEHY
jgi:hypothetical protein